MRTLVHLTCLLRNLYVGQEATVRTQYVTTDWFKIEKGVRQGCLLSPCLFNLYTEHIMRNARLDKLQAGIKIGGRNNSHRFVDDITLMAECEEKLKNLLMMVKEESERADLGLNTKKKNKKQKKKKPNPGLPHCRQTLYHLSHQGSPKIKASNPNTAWQI